MGCDAQKVSSMHPSGNSFSNSTLTNLVLLHCPLLPLLFLIVVEEERLSWLGQGEVSPWLLEYFAFFSTGAFVLTRWMPLDSGTFLVFRDQFE
jgi:hypothetical protein